MRREVDFKHHFDKRGTSIYTPKDVLEEMDLSTERNAIRDANVYLYVTLFSEDGERLGMRRKRLLPKKSIYWPTDGEPIYPSHMPVRVHLRRAVEANQAGAHRSGLWGHDGLSRRQVEDRLYLAISGN